MRKGRSTDEQMDSCYGGCLHRASVISTVAMESSPIMSRADKRADVSVVVVNYNTAHLLDEMFAALEAARGALSLQMIVVDNASRDGSADVVRTKFPNVELIQNLANVGFGRANNQALARVRGRYVLLLNTDAFVAPDTLCKTVDFMDAHPRCGVLGVKLVGRDGALQPSCRYFPTPWNVFLAATGFHRFFPGTPLVDDMSWDHASVRECDWVPACYYLVRREVVERVGLFDPRYFLYYEEVDHCWAVRQAGWSVIYYPFTEVVHIGGKSAESEGPVTSAGRQISALQIESELLYFRKHHGMTGVLAAVFLAALGDLIVACKGLAWRFDTPGAAAAARHTRTVLRLLGDTRLASRATR
jgi:N-acetylglucosaminyl-diphospho-decaprenol L-rhamnosyltransferase